MPGSAHGIKRAFAQPGAAQGFSLSEGGLIMADGTSAFQQLPGDDTLPGAVRALQVPLQAELLRSGATWEESLSILREVVSHRRPFPSAADAVAWYRGTYHPSV